LEWSATWPYGPYTNYSYDWAGRLTSYGTTTLQWDAENRLTAYTEPGRTTAYAYNGYGDRYQQTINGVAADYLLDTRSKRKPRNGANTKWAASTKNTARFPVPLVRYILKGTPHFVN
jgi:YD repeat-containing protein